MALFTLGRGMNTLLFSPVWYRVAELKLRLRDNLEIRRQTNHDQVWYTIYDVSARRHFRFPYSTYKLIGLLNGKHTVEEIWHHLCTALGDDAPSQDEVIQLLMRLSSLDLLQGDTISDPTETYKRQERLKKTKFKQALMNPLSLKFHILDPDKFLKSTIKYVNWVFSPFGLLIWFITVLIGMALGFSHFTELTNNAHDSILTAKNMLMIAAIYPIIKLFHELGHAYALKKWGGEAHDMGLVFMVFIPFPYVDASSSYLFKERYQRIIVSSAGIMVELLLASIALFIWLNTEPGLVHAICYNVILIGSISTLLFNGNPLLRYDAYYILVDLINIPNLATKSKQYIGYLFDRYIYRIENVQSPALNPKEALWFFIYGILSSLYKLFILWLIITFIIDEYFFIGVLLAIWAVSTQIIYPCVKYIISLFHSNKFKNHRLRALRFWFLSFGLSYIILFLIPAPHLIHAEGIIWLPEDAVVRASTEGTIKNILKKSGDNVQKHDTLIELDNLSLLTKKLELGAQIHEEKIKYLESQNTDKAEAKIQKNEIRKIIAEYKNINAEFKNLKIKSNSTGTFVLENPDDILGKHVKQGENLGYVLQTTSPTIKAAVLQKDINLLKEKIYKIKVKIDRHLTKDFHAKLLNPISAATTNLPSSALGTFSDGKIIVDPSDKSGKKSLEKVYLLDIILTDYIGHTLLGNRVYVKLYLEDKPLGLQWLNKLKQLFFRRFNV